MIMEHDILIQNHWPAPVRNIDKHPCFNAGARHLYGRIHLAVAPKCNVQCNFCNRKFDCTNESRPGITTAVLKPEEALRHLNEAEKRIKNLAVVGIAGPGDPFANPEETLETLERVHAAYPDKLLCVSSNGLMVCEHIPRLAKLNVSHVTLTVNAIDPEIGAKIYEWVFFNKKTYFGTEGARLLLQRQTEAIGRLKEYGITVKINTVVIPGVNTHHVHKIAGYVSGLGADIQNCIALIPVRGTPFEALREPSVVEMRAVRAKTSVYIPQMSHCARCRADAAGLLGKDIACSAGEAIANRQTVTVDVNRYIAVASSDGKRVNTHLGQASFFYIYGLDRGNVKLVEKRTVSPVRQQENRWIELANVLPDCSVILVSQAGNTPLRILKEKGIQVKAVEGPVSDLVTSLFQHGRIPEEYIRITGFCQSGNSCY
jgi:nitrogen fixation protein NifB